MSSFAHEYARGWTDSDLLLLEGDLENQARGDRELLLGAGTLPELPEGTGNAMSCDESSDATELYECCGGCNIRPAVVVRLQSGSA